MSRHRSPKQNLSRREALRRIATGAGVSDALPSLAGAAGQHTHASAAESSERLALGAALPPDPALTSPDWQPRFFDAHQSVQSFSILKESIVRAYYSSEVGMLRELKYETNPFQPEFPGCPNLEEHKSS
jgi:predicted lipid-binding transport protein (Tim44 family)